MDEEKDGSQMLVVARYNLSNFGAQLPKATTETFCAAWIVTCTYANGTYCNEQCIIYDCDCLSICTVYIMKEKKRLDAILAFSTSRRR